MRYKDGFGCLPLYGYGYLHLFAIRQITPGKKVFFRLQFAVVAGQTSPVSSMGGSCLFYLKITDFILKGALASGRPVGQGWERMPVSLLISVILTFLKY